MSYTPLGRECKIQKNVIADISCFGCDERVSIVELLRVSLVEHRSLEPIGKILAMLYFFLNSGRIVIDFVGSGNTARMAGVSEPFVLDPNACVDTCAMRSDRALSVGSETICSVLSASYNMDYYGHSRDIFPRLVCLIANFFALFECDNELSWSNYVLKIEKTVVGAETKYKTVAGLVKAVSSIGDIKKQFADIITQYIGYIKNNNKLNKDAVSFNLLLKIIRKYNALVEQHCKGLPRPTIEIKFFQESHRFFLPSGSSRESSYEGPSGPQESFTSSSLAPDDSPGSQLTPPSSTCQACKLVAGLLVLSASFICAGGVGIALTFSGLLEDQLVPGALTLGAIALVGGIAFGVVAVAWHAGAKEEKDQNARLLSPV